MLRVFMLSHLPLFSQGVEVLLCREGGVEIVGRASDIDTAVLEVKRLRPDVVILDTALQETEVASIAARILTAQPSTLVAAMGIADNTVTVFREEKRQVHGIQDLMRAIGNGLVHSNPS